MNEEKVLTEDVGMTREVFEKHWDTINIRSVMPSGLSMSPADGESLVEAKVIKEGALPRKRREAADEDSKARSYEIMGMGVSFVPGIPDGTVIWIGRWHTVVAVTTDGGKLANS